MRAAARNPRLGTPLARRALSASHPAPPASHLAPPASRTAGSNFDDDRMGGIEKKWKSETMRKYAVEDFRARIWEAKTSEACGVRSEQLSG